jgi:hypothetical protein
MGQRRSSEDIALKLGQYWGAGGGIRRVYAFMKGHTTPGLCPTVVPCRGGMEGLQVALQTGMQHAMGGRTVEGGLPFHRLRETTICAEAVVGFTVYQRRSVAIAQAVGILRSKGSSDRKNGGAQRRWRIFALFVASFFLFVQPHANTECATPNTSLPHQSSEAYSQGCA